MIVNKRGLINDSDLTRMHILTLFNDENQKAKAHYGKLVRIHVANKNNRYIFTRSNWQKKVCSTFKQSFIDRL